VMVQDACGFFKRCACRRDVVHEKNTFWSKIVLVQGLICKRPGNVRSAAILDFGVDRCLRRCVSCPTEKLTDRQRQPRAEPLREEHRLVEASQPFSLRVEWERNDREVLEC